MYDIFSSFESRLGHFESRCIFCLMMLWDMQSLAFRVWTRDMLCVVSLVDFAICGNDAFDVWPWNRWTCLFSRSGRPSMQRSTKPRPNFSATVSIELLYECRIKCHQQKTCCVSLFFVRLYLVKIISQYFTFVANWKMGLRRSLPYVIFFLLFNRD